MRARAHDLAADEIALVAVPDHLCAAHAAEGPKRGHEVNGLQDIGLALRVVPQQQVKAGRELRVQPGVIAEVPQPEVSQMHAGRMRRAGGRGEPF